MATTEARRLTRTACPPDVSGRYRQSWGTSQECAHRWAANQLPGGRSGSVFFSGGTFYSYGTHFPVARWVRLSSGETAVFFTTRGYSSSTARHKSECRQAIPGSAAVFYVPDVLADTRDAHRANLKAIGESAADLVRKAANPRAGAARSRYRSEAAGLIADGNAYAAAVGLKDRLGPPEGGDLADWLAQVERDAAKEKARAAKAEARRVATAMAEWEQKLSAWKEGGEWPGNRPDGSREAYLRVKGKVLETSQRAAVPVRAVLPILEAVRGTAGLPDGFAVDGYRLDGIDRDERTVTVGCHVVSFDEIERIAAELNL